MNPSKTTGLHDGVQVGGTERTRERTHFRKQDSVEQERDGMRTGWFATEAENANGDGDTVRERSGSPWFLCPSPSRSRRCNSPSQSADSSGTSIPSARTPPFPSHGFHADVLVLLLVVEAPDVMRDQAHRVRDLVRDPKIHSLSLSQSQESPPYWYNTSSNPMKQSSIMAVVFQVTRRAHLSSHSA